MHDQTDASSGTPGLAEAWTAMRAELIAFVARRVESREVAEDIVHDVLERFQRSNDVDPVANANAWLYRSARNAIVDHYRARRPHDSLPEDFQAIELVDSGPNAATRELSQCLHPLIEQLPGKYRTAVTLVDLEGQTHQTAATAEAISVSGMKSRVQRGRSKLGEMIKECCDVATNSHGEITDFRANSTNCGC